mgnify:FL=1
MNKLTVILLGALAIIFGMIIIYFSIRGKYKRNDTAWNYQMRFKGFVGGALFIFLGVTMISNALIS